MKTTYKKAQEINNVLEINKLFLIISLTHPRRASDDALTPIHEYQPGQDISKMHDVHYKKAF
jgi:hypothetical protein